METKIIARRTNAHGSRRERRRLDRAEAFSRQTPRRRPQATLALSAREVALIGRLVGEEDRTPLSSGLLLVAGEESR